MCYSRATSGDPGSETPRWRGFQFPVGDRGSRAPCGPQSPHLCNGAAPLRRAPGTRRHIAPLFPPARPPGPGSHVLGGPGQRAGLPAQGRDGTPARPPKNGRWRRAPVPADPGAPRSRAPSRGPRPAGLRTRGSPEQELRAERARRPPPTHAQCRCAPRGRRPARLCKPGTAGRRGAGGAAGRVLSGDHEGSSRQPRAAPTSPGGWGWGCSGLVTSWV